MKIICRNCSTENRHIARYCKKCGKPIIIIDTDSLNELTGRDEIKTALNELVKSVSQFKKGWSNPTTFNINMLLLGNTGTGKTLLANVIPRFLFRSNIISKETPFIFDASEFDGFIENIEDHFKKAKGGIIFIDNIDKVLSSRG